MLLSNGRLDCSANSIPYLASWAEQASLEVLEQTAQLTGRLAARIESALLAEPRAQSQAISRSSTRRSP